MMLAEELIDCSTDSEKCIFRSPYGNRMTWLLIETSAFYLYVFATIFYMAWHMIRGVCETPDDHSDRSKAIQDFIVYTSMNLTWFSLNFVLCTMPAVCIFWLNKNETLVRKRYDGSYAPIMYIIWITHMIVLFFKKNIIKEQRMGIG